MRPAMLAAAITRLGLRGAGLGDVALYAPPAPGSHLDQQVATPIGVLRWNGTAWALPGQDS